MFAFPTLVVVIVKSLLCYARACCFVCLVCLVCVVVLFVDCMVM